MISSIRSIRTSLGDDLKNRNAVLCTSPTLNNGDGIVMLCGKFSVCVPLVTSQSYTRHYRTYKPLIYHAITRVYCALLFKFRGSCRNIYHQIIVSYVIVCPLGNSTAVCYSNYLTPHMAAKFRRC